jgi:hypothetical protein
MATLTCPAILQMARSVMMKDAQFLLSIAMWLPAGRSRERR